MHNNHNNYHNL